MKVIKIVALILIGISTLIGISYWLFTKDSSTTIYQGEYKNKAIKVKVITTPGFSRNSTSYSLKYGNLKPIYINAFSTDIRGVPYDDSVFKKVKPMYIDTSIIYRNEVIFDNAYDTTMLYISNQDFTEQEYLEYEDFFKNDWPRVQNILADSPYGFSTRIIGVVYGDRKNFIKTFSGTYEKKKFNLIITPDGEINLSSAENTMFLQNSGFNNKVQMPGKILLRRPNEIPYSPNYYDFLDENGKHLGAYFTIK